MKKKNLNLPSLSHHFFGYRTQSVVVYSVSPSSYAHLQSSGLNKFTKTSQLQLDRTY